MKRSTRFLTLGFAIIGLLGGEALANDGGIISSANVERVGLSVDWFTQIDVQPGGRIVDIDLVVNENNSTTYFALEYGRQREVVSQHDLDAFGNPYGIEGAQARVELRKEIVALELKAANRKDEIKINRYTLPESSIYAVTDTGLVSAVNADTGQQLWAARIGTRRHPTIGIGANDKYVAAINGIKVYCLDAKTGKVLFIQECNGIATSSPAIGGEDLGEPKSSEGFVYVPLTSGNIQKFPIATNGLGSSYYTGVGRPTARPLVTQNSISWPTAKGHYNVVKRFGNETGGISYRLKSYDAIVSPANSIDKYIYVASLDGFVYAIDEEAGAIRWEFSTGERISQSPIPVGNHLFLITEANELYKVDGLTGAPAEGWEKPVQGIVDYVGASENRIYATDRLGNLVALSMRTGQRVGQIGFGQLSFILPNYESDRLYVGYSSGLIQSLHEIGSPTPFFHSRELEKLAVESKPVVEPEKVMDAAADEGDPFKSFDSKPAKTDESDPFAPKKSSGSDDGDPFAPTKKGDSGGDPFAPGK